jgi:hypothetical protein
MTVMIGIDPHKNRQLNWAIHTAAVSQLRHPCEGREYYDRNAPRARTPKKRSARSSGNSPTWSTGPWSRTLADSSSDRRAREDNQERHEIQRDRLNILNGRLFG